MADPSSEGAAPRAPSLVTEVPHTDISVLMRPGTEKRQDMRGFDDDYVDIVDYIVRCTHKIWEGKDLGLIDTHYAHDVLIHTSDGQTMEREGVVAASAKTMAAFPDIRLYADDVIWTGDADAGFHTSHRITWTGRNTGYSLYGPPTHRKVVRAGIAHCVVKANRVVEEWICRDELALVVQLGFDPVDLARRVTARAAAAGATAPGAVAPALADSGEAPRRRGQLPPERPPQPAAGDPEAFVAAMLQDVWNGRMVGRVASYYAPHLVASVPGHRTLHGLGSYQAHVLGLLAAFPDLALVIDHQCHLGDEARGYRVATRWFLAGTHDGPGPYGDPTGRPVTAWGISHHLLRGGRIEREWMIFDAFALIKQIHWPAA